MSSPRRLLWAGLFLAWGCLLAGLLLSGRLAHYLASRNRPFVAFAAVALVAVGIASARRSGVAHSGDPDDELHELSCRCRRAQVPGSTELVSVALFLLPVVVLAVVPSGTLGASAAPDNTWVTVEGTLTWTAAHGLVRPTEVLSTLTVERVEPVTAPGDPYLY